LFENPPDLGGVIRDAKLTANHSRHPWQGPEVSLEPEGLGPLAQQLGKLCPLFQSQLGPGAKGSKSAAFPPVGNLTRKIPFHEFNCRTLKGALTKKVEWNPNSIIILAKSNETFLFKSWYLCIGALQKKYVDNNVKRC
jgi:hypothetical protein